MMKKVLFILLMVLFMFIMISCTDEKADKSPIDDKQTEEPEKTEEPKEDEKEPDPIITTINKDLEGVVGNSVIIELSGITSEDNVEGSSNNEEIATVSANGEVTFLKVGEVQIIAVINEITIIIYDTKVTKPEPVKLLSLSGKTEMIAGEIATIDLIFGEEEFDVTWKSTNPSVALIKNGIIFALQEGTTTIKATKSSDSSIRASLNINVAKYQAPEYTEEEINFAKNIIKDMTVDELIGQMFIGSYAGTELSTETVNAIKNNKLGNFIFMGNNTPSGVSAALLAASLQEVFMEELGIPAFISIDQETGRISRLTNGATRFLGNMASAATGDAHDRYLIGEAVGEELRTYGINFDLAPVLDVNNNPDNPVINNRSFSDNQLIVALYGEEMMKGLMSKNVMACAKHFPGHGNTATDSHYGLPIINSNINSLYQVELAPFIHAIYSGIDAIMTTHILFTELDSEYPATLSHKILTEFLREKLGFNGLIVTDGMEMQAITKYYGAKQAAVLAVKAGADMLCYTTISNAVTGIQAVKEAYNAGEISRSRLEESVMRILIKKNKYNLFDDYLPKSGYEKYDLTSHQALNLELAKKAVTVYKGEFNGLDKTKKTIIFSSKCSYTIKNYSGNNNSFGKFAQDYLKQNGMSDVDYVYISSMGESDIDNFMTRALGYDQIVVAVSDANATQIKFVNKLASARSDLIVVALNLPYDINNYDNVNTYICLFENTPIMVEALVYLMNGEYKPAGVSPIQLNK